MEKAKDKKMDKKIKPKEQTCLFFVMFWQISQFSIINLSCCTVTFPLVYIL